MRGSAAKTIELDFCLVIHIIPLIKINSFSIKLLYPAYHTVMSKTMWRRLFYALFLSLVVVWCSGLWWARNGSNATYASVITSSWIIATSPADLKPTSLYVTLGGCYHGSIPSLAGTRRANFYYKIRNIGGTISPNFFIIIVNQSWFLGGGWSPTLIPGWQYVTETYWTYVPTGSQYFTLTVYPLDALYYQVWWSWNNYINWSLDSNPNNNVIGYKISIPACP